MDTMVELGDNVVLEVSVMSEDPEDAVIVTGDVYAGARLLGSVDEVTEEL